MYLQICTKYLQKNCAKTTKASKKIPERDFIAKRKFPIYLSEPFQSHMTEKVVNWLFK